MRLRPVTKPKLRAEPAKANAPAWHSVDVDTALRRLDSTPEGLSTTEAADRLKRFGANTLRPPKRRSAFIRFIDQFRNVLIYVLILAGVVTALLGHWVDASVIVAVVLVNAVIGFLQEGKAEHALEAIRGMLSYQAAVLRDGRRTSISAQALVPGDVVLVESGDRIPADLRLIETKSLRLQEAALTGESMPVDKNVAEVSESTPLGDRRCMAYSGTLVAAGRGTGVVVATGDDTELGRIGAMIADVSPVLTTPLLAQMTQFARALTGVIVLAAALTFVFGLLVRGYGAVEMFLAAVGIAVAAIPEGLPAIMTITLAIGVQRMASRNAIIRRLPAVETLGSVTVICSDKTGTLTRNEMAVQSLVTSRNLYEVTGTGYVPRGDVMLAGQPMDLDTHPLLREMARGAMLCSDASIRKEEGSWSVHGDPTEGALVALAGKLGLDGTAEARLQPRTDVIPFESEHRFMATLHHGREGGGTIYIKGAPERLLLMCEHQRGYESDEPLNAAYWRNRMTEIAARGQRVLALAYRFTSNDHRSLAHDDVQSGLVLLGLFGLADPPRKEAVQAVAKCRHAGIHVKMITGDHVDTARAVGRLIGLDSTGALAGPELDAIPAEALSRRALETDIFARASPEHKLRLVEALQAEGQVVAMTGDGVNDAPALKRADVGVAMGRKGTEAAREAAEMVLVDDNFASIADAVEEGRTVYDNLKKAITFILPTSGGEALVIIAAIALGQMLPITPVQILWINMITAVTLGLALAFEPAEPGVMQLPPRPPRAPLLSRFLVWRVGFVSVILLLGTFGLFLWERSHGMNLAAARTVAVNTLVAFEAFYLLSCRRLYAPALEPSAVRGATPAVLAIALVVVFQLLFTYTAPMQELFDTRGLGAAAWGRIILIAASVLVLVELEKGVMRRLPPARQHEGHGTAANRGYSRAADHETRRS